jgi:hypothetical protein
MTMNTLRKDGQRCRITKTTCDGCQSVNRCSYREKVLLPSFEFVGKVTDEICRLTESTTKCEEWCTVFGIPMGCGRGSSR